MPWQEQRAILRKFACYDGKFSNNLTLLWQKRSKAKTQSTTRKQSVHGSRAFYIKPVVETNGRASKNLLQRLSEMSDSEAQGICRESSEICEKPRYQKKADMTPV
jgi:hypothetical protein